MNLFIPNALDKSFEKYTLPNSNTFLLCAQQSTCTGTLADKIFKVFVKEKRIYFWHCEYNFGYKRYCSLYTFTSRLCVGVPPFFLLRQCTFITDVHLFQLLFLFFQGLPLTHNFASYCILSLNITASYIVGRNTIQCFVAFFIGVCHVLRLYALWPVVSLLFLNQNMKYNKILDDIFFSQHLITAVSNLHTIPCINVCFLQQLYELYLCFSFLVAH